MKNNTKNINKKIAKNRFKKVLIFSIFALIIYTTFNVVFSKININISNSHPGTIFWKSDKKPQIGDYIYFEFEHKLLPKNIKTLSKKLVCIENNQLIINNKFIICSGKKYSIKRNKKTGSMKLINQFYYDGIVPKEKAVVWGENFESFDSRYWGFIDYDRLKTIRLIL